MRTLSDLSDIESVAIKFYRFLLRLHPNSSIDLAKGELGRSSLNYKIHELVINYWFKLVNSEPSSFTHQSYLGRSVVQWLAYWTVSPLVAVRSPAMAVVFSSSPTANGGFVRALRFPPLMKHDSRCHLFHRTRPSILRYRPECVYYMNNA